MSILGDGRLADQTPLLIWANKMDVEGSITESELSERLALWERPDCSRRQWCIQGSVMHDRGLGVEHGMKWLYLTLSQKQTKKWTSAERYTVENDRVAESVTPTKPHSKPALSAASAATQSSSGRARLYSTAESIVEEGADEEEESDDDEERTPRSAQVNAEYTSQITTTARSTLTGTGTNAAEVETLRTVWNTPYVANYNYIPAKSANKGREFRVLVAGMEGAGKTTFMMQLEKKTAITWAPPATPVGGEMTIQKHREHNLIVWDMNGSVQGRAKWGSHVEAVGSLSAIIYVVDSTARFMLGTARHELERVTRFKSIDPSVPLLLIANKMDAANPMDCQQVAETMALQKIPRRWRVQECSATLGTGVEQAMDWLCAAESAKPRKHEGDLLAEENSRIFGPGRALAARQSTGSAVSPDADMPAYQMGTNYRVTKRAGKGKGQQLKLSCGAVGINTFKYTGEHVKSYPYKELADWVQGTHAGKEMITLFKRDRSMAGTEFFCDKSGDASRIIADLDRMVRGGATPVELVAQSTTISNSPQRGDVSKRLERARRLLWAAIEADEQDLPEIAVRRHACPDLGLISAVYVSRCVDCSRCVVALCSQALGTEVEILSEIANGGSPSSDTDDAQTTRPANGQLPPPESPVAGEDEEDDV